MNSFFIIFLFVTLAFSSPEQNFCKKYNAIPTPFDIKAKFSKAIDWEVEAETFPESYDLRTEHSECVSLKTVLQQSTCGSCWTFASTGAAADRACIAQKANAIMSAQYQLSCDHSCFSGTSTCQLGCGGGYLQLAFGFQVQNGVVTQSCHRYSNGVAACPTTCDDGSSLSPVYPISYNRLTTPAQMQRALMSGGTLAAVYQVYSDNDEYKSGVYVHQVNTTEGHHAIKIVGWGVEGTTPYWIIQNSWGASWGDHGYFKMLRGSNECGIESDVWEVVFPPHVDPCSAHASCDNCTAATGCGWCASSKSCMTGGSDGPTERGAYCTSGWGLDTCVEDGCAMYSASCDQCTLRAGCGWCIGANGQATCARGNSDGPMQLLGGPEKPSCAAWKMSGECPPDPCASSQTCAACTGRTGCGWCADIGQCISGTESSPASGQCTAYLGNSTACPADECTNHGSCASCLASGAAGAPCSWCPSTASCMSASSALDRCNGTGGAWTAAAQCPVCASVVASERTGISNCSSCSAVSGCGWCGSTLSCEVGTADGLMLANASCPVWSKTTCPGKCADYTDCGSCALDFACGWCGVRQTCMAGRSEGATSSVCPHTWANFKMQCPISAASRSRASFLLLFLALVVILCTAV